MIECDKCRSFYTPNPYAETKENLCPLCSALAHIKSLTERLQNANKRVEELEKTISLIGERAVVDFDDDTVGVVDKVVPDNKKYHDWLVEMFRNNDKVKVLHHIASCSPCVFDAGTEKERSCKLCLTFIDEARAAFNYQPCPAVPHTLIEKEDPIPPYCTRCKSAKYLEKLRNGTWFCKDCYSGSHVYCPEKGTYSDVKEKDEFTVKSSALDTFISSALKELGEETFLVLPENRMLLLKQIMIKIVALRSNPMFHLSASLKKDKDYAWGWYCNLAQTAVSCGAPQEQADATADAFMRLAFGCRYEDYCPTDMRKTN